jgi:hypothetical protein
VEKRTKSLLEEINSISPKRDKTQLIESRGTNALGAIINLLEMIDSNYDTETAEDFQKRVLLSIKSRDNTRFLRGIKKLRDNS